MEIILIALGGALGSVFRHLSYVYSNYLVKNNANNFLTKIVNSFPPSFPFATFFVNILGSILAGFIYYLVIKNFENFNPLLKNFLFFGFLGGFTTFSAFSLDFFRLFSAGQIWLAISYALLSVILAILAVFFGFYLAKIIF
jgi:fluoride exporter